MNGRPGRPRPPARMLRQVESLARRASSGDARRVDPHPLTLPVPPLAPQAFGPLGHFPAFRRDVLGFMLACMEAGPLVRLSVPRFQAYVTSHPDAVKRILVDEVKHYSKQTRGFAELRNVLGNGLLTSEGDFWLRQRRLMQPSFHREPLGRFAAPIVAAGERLASRWLDFARTGVVFDVSRELMAITLDIVTATLMGSSVGGDSAIVGRSMETILEAVQRRLGSPVPTSIDFPLPRNLRLVRARDAVRALALRLIEQRREGEARGDLLSVLLEARDPETGDAMTDEQLRDEVLTMIAAGHETTANALTWTFHLLGEYPEEDARLEHELDTVLAGRSPTLEDLPRLVHTQGVLKEALRLYPPAWTVARLAERDDALLGYLVPRGTHVFASIFAIHRNPRFWDTPNRFLPDRFTDAAERARPRHAYLPFGAGPHLCIGQPFAMLEGVLLLATLRQRLRLVPLDGQVVTPEPFITLRPRGGLLRLASAR